MKEDSSIRWGIVGTGRIARRFAQGLAHVPGVTIASLWSRRAEPAEAFAREYGGAAYASLDALLASGIDAVYIATHQDSHAAYAIAALEAGVHVLCEKPATINAVQLDSVLDAARAAQRLFMEAMKPPFYPLYRQLRAQLAADPIGAVGLVRAGCSVPGVPAGHPSLSFEHAGGALLDIGIYEMFLAVDWLGAPLDVQTIGRLGTTGVDSRELVEPGARDDPLRGWPYRRTRCAVRRRRPQLRDRAFLRADPRGATREPGDDACEVAPDDRDGRRRARDARRALRGRVMCVRVMRGDTCW